MFSYKYRNKENEPFQFHHLKSVIGVYIRKTGVGLPVNHVLLSLYFHLHLLPHIPLPLHSQVNGSIDLHPSPNHLGNISLAAAFFSRMIHS